MAEMTSYPEGAFCWPELATTDQKAAVAFYRAVFGWNVKDEPIGPTEVYSMLRVGDKDAGAAYTMRPEERQMGMPPHWNSYVNVTSADAAAARAEELGGKVVVKPFDVMDAGRMAVIQDPTGAYVHVWQKGKSAGARVKREPGALCWTELTTGDTGKAEQFYSQLFGWKAKHSSMPGTEYTELLVDGTPEAGMMPTPKEMPNVPPNWLPYFEVTDADATASKVTVNGGKAIVPPTDIPNVGRFSVLQDPQGAVFAIIKMTQRV
jgi:predicted enzyme related to lactoylglutathione lyase